MSPEKKPPLEPLVKLANIPGRGRALIASRHINPGEIVLTDSPLLLYPSSSPSPFCFHCFRSLSPSPLPCPLCSSPLFCSPLCLSSSHHSSTCPALTSLPPLSQSPHLYPQINFLLAAFHLSSTSPPLFHLLLSLHGEAAPIHQDAVFLHSLLGSFTGFSLETIALLVGKDKRNAFGIMEPFGGEGGVRGYGIYPKASFFNHDCLPNACRFDYFEEGESDITVRAIHDIPEGREVCLSYFPVKWRYGERQKRLVEEYGFCCRCDRCEVEKNWNDGEGEGEEDMEEGDEEEDGEDDFPHAYFFVRYVCERENCGGTMAPLPPSLEGDLSGVMECNVCGGLRKEDGFGGEGDDGDGSLMVDD